MKKQFTLSAVLVFLVLTSAFGQSIREQSNGTQSKSFIPLVTVSGRMIQLA